MRRRWANRGGPGGPDNRSGDVRKLRDQARKSKKTRQAVAEDIKLEQALHATLGSPPLPTSQVVAEATRGASRRAYRSRFTGALAGWLVVMLATAALPFLAVSVLPEPEVRPGDIPRPQGDSGVELVPEKRSQPEAVDPRVEAPPFVDDDSSPSDRKHPVTPPPETDEE